MFSKIAVGMVGLVLLLVAGVWVSQQLSMTAEVPSPEKSARGQRTAFFEFSVTTKADYIRVDGTADFPNGVILLGALDKVGSGRIEVKEALVMNRLFALEFGPDLMLQYYLQGPQRALQAGIYRLSIEFDPAQQSPFAQEALLRWSQSHPSPAWGDLGKDPDPAIIRMSRILTIGTPEEQREAQVLEQEYRQMVRQHLNETMASLTNLLHRLQTHYQEERLKGSFGGTDPRGEAWRLWSAQWRSDLDAVAEKGQLHDAVSPASPLLGARDALATALRQLMTLRDLYGEVLTNERPAADRDLQRTERAIQQAFANAGIYLGHLGAPFPATNVEDVKPTVIITAPVVNIRQRPGMIHDAIGQAKKDEVFDLLGEQGEWFHIQLSGGRTGWVHRNIATRQSRPGGPAEGLRGIESGAMAAERKSPLHLDPVNILAMPATHIPRPTPDEIRIYREVEVQLRDLKARSGEERKAIEQGILQRTADTWGISPDQIWSTYLKVQGWEVAQ
jgi:hypothetical protein